MKQTFTRFLFHILMITIVPLAVKGQSVQTNNENTTVRIETDPTNPSTTLTSINFTLLKDSYVNLKIFDPLGNQVLELAHGSYKAGDYSIPVDAPNLHTGIYFYRLSVNDQTETKKLSIKK